MRKKTDTLSVAEVKKLLKTEKPRIVLCFNNVKCNTRTNPDIYSDEEDKRFKEIIDHMSKEIYFDRSYVRYKGNKSKSAFLLEDEWYSLLKYIMKTSIGQKVDKKTEKVAGLMYQIIVMTYLFQVATMYGYNLDDIEITFKDTKWKISYTTEENVILN